MSDRLSVLRDARAKAYLAEVHMAVAAVDPAAADGIMREIADHLREAAAEPGFDLDATLADLGDPALIAAGVEPVAPPRAPGGFTDSVAGVVVTVLALTVGTWWTFVVGWIVGVALLWSSRRWSRTDKVIGTAAWPFALLAGLSGTAFGGVAIWDATLAAMIFVPLLAGGWLLVRGLGGIKPPAPTRRTVVARQGRGAWLERPVTAAVVLGGAVLAVGGLVALALVAGVDTGVDAGVGGGAATGAMPAVLLTLGAVAIAGSLTVLWLSRSWEASDKTLGTILLGVAVGAGALAWAGALAAGRAVAVCTSAGCETLLTPDGDVVLVTTAQLVVPLVLTFGVLLGARFRAADAPPPVSGGRARATAVVAAVTAGGVGFVLLVLSLIAASAPLLAAAVASLVLWAAGVVGVWRAPGWTGIDRAAATLTLPLLAAVPLLMPRRYAMPAEVGGGVNPLLPGATSEPDTVLLWAVFGAVSAILATWLLVRFVPDERSRGAGGGVAGAARADVGGADVAGGGTGGRGAAGRGVAARRAASVSPRLVGTLGFVAVCLYAVLAAVQILVWNPLAAAPGSSLQEIYAHLGAAGESFSLPQIGILGIGPLLALAPAILSWRRGATAAGTAAAVCGVIAGGAFGYFAASFGPGMSLADAYGISGGDHAPWGYLLMLVSGVAFVGGVMCLFVWDRRRES